jgi:hypothetical protein
MRALLLIGAVIVIVAMFVVAKRKQAARTTLGMLTPGTTVQVTTDHSWAPGATGIVALPPRGVAQLVSEWTDTARVFSTLKWTHTTYWIIFKEPHRDADGDGPFVAAEINAKSLTPVAAQDQGGAVTWPEDDLALVWFENRKLGYRVEFKAKKKLH